MINLFYRYKEDTPQPDVKRRKNNRTKYRCYLFTFLVCIFYAITIGRLYLRTNQQHMVAEFLKAEIKKLHKEIDNHTNKQQIMYENLTTEVAILRNRVHGVLQNNRERKSTVKSDPAVGGWTNDYEFELNKLKNWTNWLQKHQEDYDEKLEYIFLDLDRLDHVISRANVLPSEDNMLQLETKSASDNNANVTTGPVKGNMASQIYVIQYSVDKLDAKMRWMYNKLKEHGLVRGGSSRKTDASRNHK